VSGSVEIWTDGGCQGNPGPGGWAYVIHSTQGSGEKMGFEAFTTNNRMELIAVREALKDLTVNPKWRGLPVTISTDSQYVQKGITQWIHAWARNGWKTSAKKPVKNAELWSALWDLSRSLQLHWVWVKGHAGNEMNERCDFLVQQAIAQGLKRQD
jgi:ribonuclease HI